MSLTPEERQRIYEEEKARAEAQEKAQSEIKNKKRQQGCLGCLTVLAILIGFIIYVASQSPSVKTPPPPSTSASRSTTTAATSETQTRGHLLIRLTKYQYNADAQWVEVEGTVTNDGTATIYSPTIVGEAYSASGTLLGQDLAWPEGQYLSNMAPGTSAGFSMLIPIKGGTLAKAAVYARDAESKTIYPH